MGKAWRPAIRVEGYMVGYDYITGPTLTYAARERLREQASILGLSRRERQNAQHILSLVLATKKCRSSPEMVAAACYIAAYPRLKIQDIANRTRIPAKKIKRHIYIFATEYNIRLQITPFTSYLRAYAHRAARMFGVYFRELLERAENIANKTRQMRTRNLAAACVFLALRLLNGRHREDLARFARAMNVSYHSLRCKTCDLRREMK